MPAVQITFDVNDDVNYVKLLTNPEKPTLINAIQIGLLMVYCADLLLASPVDWTEQNKANILAIRTLLGFYPSKTPLGLTKQ